jgi:TRAP-type C4-dicarboxylate transport system permease small subunit
MDRVFARIEQAVVVLLAGLLLFITAGVFLQVILRYVFATTFLWGEELSLFAFIWCVYLGAAIGVLRRNHFGFDFLAESLQGRWAGGQRLFVDLCVLAVAVLMLVQGWTFSELSILRLSPALGISLLIPTVVIPLSGALMILFVLFDIARDLRQLATGQRA